MKVQTIPAGTVLKFMGQIPVRLLEDTKVECATDLPNIQDVILDVQQKPPTDSIQGNDWDAEH